VLYAPRILNDPVRWRFSAFRNTGRPESRVNVSDAYSGVTRATSSSRPRAASTSAIVGPVKVEHLLQDLVHGRQRIELAPLNRCEDAPELGVVGDLLLEA